MFDFLKLGGGGKKETKEDSTPKPAITIGAPAPTAPAPTTAQAQLTTSEGREVTAVVEDLEKEVERLKDSMNVVKESIKNVNTKLEDLEKTMGQLASIYEIVMNQLNPFLDEDEKALPVRPPKTERQPAQPTSPAPAPEEPKKEIVQPPQPERAPEEVVLPQIDLTNPKIIETVIDWARFMVEKVGHQGIDDLLQYYVDIRWISQDVAEIMKKYTEGIRVDIEPDVESIQLDPEDHAKSLEYILTIKDLMNR